jgi:predicted nuclease with TOPRIM domain
MKAWEHLLEVYTGHADIRGKLKEIEELVHFAEQVNSDATELEEARDSLATDAAELKERLEALRKELRKGGMKRKRLSSLNGAIQSMDEVVDQLDSSQTYVEGANYAADEAKGDMRDVKQSFLSSVKKGNYKPR